MKFDELDRKMRVFETASDICILPGIHMVARLDGRNFTRLTKETHKFEAPFDIHFRDYMVATTEHLMQSGFNVIFAYTQSDEISLLFHLNESTFQRKMRKYVSILAGEASAKFSLLLGDLAAFDCRICQLPTHDLVMDYFRWRNEDAHRNSLNAHCYWLLRSQSKSVKEATTYLLKKSVAEKNEFLFQNGVNFNDLPNWQKRGIGFYWETFTKDGVNPVTNEKISTQRRRIKVDLDLPVKDEYGQIIVNILNSSILESINT